MNNAEIASVEPRVGPRRVGNFRESESLARKAAIRLIVQVSVEVRVKDRSRAGEAVVLANAGRTGRTQHTVEADVAVAVIAIEEHGTACVARGEPVAMDVVRVLDLAFGRVDFRRQLTDAVVLLAAGARADECF